MAAVINNNTKKLFVLDTNVLMHDPTSIFRFQEHHIFIPMVVLEELDHAKKGLSDISRNARQASRFLDDLVHGMDQQAIAKGLVLSQIESLNQTQESTGRLFFQTRQLNYLLPENLPGQIADNSILGIALALSREHPETKVILVSKDINMRIKAAALGISAEDYFSDQTIDDIKLLYNGTQSLSLDFWDRYGKDMESWTEQSRTFYRLETPVPPNWYPNQYLYMEDDSFEAIVQRIEQGSVVLGLARDFRHAHHSVWGVCAKNREQNFALNALLNPDVDFVTLIGAAGTGKTLLALAAGLVQVMDAKIYQEIIMTRETVPVGQDIGFLPGTEEEKMAPWMGALMDNLELLGSRSGNSDWEQGASYQVLMNRVKIRALNFMRGRTFLKRYLIIDEAQNLTPKQMKTLITRAGPGTKIVCIGNLAQIDTPYLTATSSGLTYVVDRFKSWQNSAHITLRRGERSRLADYASDRL